MQSERCPNCDQVLPCQCQYGRSLIDHSDESDIAEEVDEDEAYHEDERYSCIVKCREIVYTAEFNDDQLKTMVLLQEIVFTVKFSA